MANQSDSKEGRLVSSARSGMKRELAFALKSQVDWSGSIGRTRGKRLQNAPNGCGDEVSEDLSKKRFKKSADVKEEAPIDKENVQIGEILNGGGEKSTCNEESKLDSVKLMVEEEPTKESTKSSIEERALRENCSVEEAKAEVPMVIDNIVEGQNEVLERTVKRFTRSSLKASEDSAEVSAIATSSGSTVVSDDACKIESTAISPFKTLAADNIGLKMAKGRKLTKAPTNVKELFDTGLLEGMPVRYALKSQKTALSGIVKGRGILCSCTKCKGSEVVTAHKFEKHAGSNNRHPSSYIYLENGKNLREVLDECKMAPLEELENTIEVVISTSKRQSRLPKSVSTPKSSGSDSALVSTQTKSKGKLTRKDLRLHKLVFEEEGLPDGTELGYYIHGEKIIEGYKKGLGIFCRCCNREVSPSQFEAHAGHASRRKPYLNIYTSNGVSLHELSVSLSRGRKLSIHENDDLCRYCAEYGDLLCCDTCPRAFHLHCVGLPSIPEGKWYCPYCVNMYEREKHCEYNENAKAAGRVSGVDPIEQIKKRCIRIVETTETEIGGCNLCRCQNFSKSEFGPSTVIICDQCEKEYHVGCLRDHKMADLKELPEGKWFCGAECKRIHSILRILVGQKPEKLPDSLLDIIIKKQEQKYPNEVGDFDVSWRVLNGQEATPQSKVLLSKAIAIFHDHFDPIMDASTGHDLIPAMVYGRSVRDQDFSGMYCAVLTVGSNVVSAAILRVFGPDTAEIPLVATTSDNQGRGYFQSLYACIERLLGFLRVKTIVLPSAEESKSIWINRFGYRMILPDQLIEYRKQCQMMVFQGTSMLHKRVPKVAVYDESSGKMRIW